MSEWTPEARAYLEGYLMQVRALAKSAGDNENEIADELKGHIVFDVEDESGSIVTVDQLRAILTRIGSPEQIIEGKVIPPSQPKATTQAAPPIAPVVVPRRSGFRVGACLLLLVVLALVVAAPILAIFAYQVRSFSQANEAAAEKRAVSALEKLVELEREYITETKKDIDGDDIPDYADLLELKAWAEERKSIDLQQDYFNQGLYHYAIEVIGSGSKGGGDFIVSAEPFSHAEGRLRKYTMSKTGKLSSSPATMNETVLDESEGAVQREAQAATEKQAVSALEKIAELERNYLTQSKKDIDGDAKPDYADLLELKEWWRNQPDGADLEQSYLNQGPYHYTVEVIGSGAERGGNFTVSAEPFSQGDGRLRAYRMDKTGKLLFRKAYMNETVWYGPDGAIRDDGQTAPAAKSGSAPVVEAAPVEN